MWLLYLPPWVSTAIPKNGGAIVGSEELTGFPFVSCCQCWLNRQPPPPVCNIDRRLSHEDLIQCHAAHRSHGALSGEEGRRACPPIVFVDCVGENVSALLLGMPTRSLDFMSHEEEKAAAASGAPEVVLIHGTTVGWHLRGRDDSPR
jgi:hypothetical protein